MYLSKHFIAELVVPYIFMAGLDVELVGLVVPV